MTANFLITAGLLLLPDWPFWEIALLGTFLLLGATLATALFALLVVGQLELLERGDEILSIAVLAVLISALLHGVSAAPGARWFARRFDHTTNAPAPGDQAI